MTLDEDMKTWVGNCKRSSTELLEQESVHFDQQVTEVEVKVKAQVEAFTHKTWEQRCEVVAG